MTDPTRTRHSCLTDRYVWAATHRLPEKGRADVEAELRATIADMLDARVEGGSGADAEAAVLTELGDPGRLAAEYRGRPNYLIGPDFFDDYARLLRLLLSIVPAAAGGGVAVASLIAGDGLIALVARALGVALTAALHVAFWTTLGFAVVERTGAERPSRPGRPWEPSQLPELPTAGRVGPADVIPSVLYSALAIGLLFWQRGVSSFTTPDGDPIPFFNPDRWSFWLPFVVAVLAADAVADLARLRKRRWTYPSAAVATALGALLVAPFLGLFGADPMINPAFLAEVGAVTGSPTPGALLAQVVVIAIVAVTAWDVVDKWVKARRAAASG